MKMIWLEKYTTKIYMIWK